MACISTRKPQSLGSNELTYRIGPGGNHLCKHLQVKWKHDKKLIVISDLLFNAYILVNLPRKLYYIFLVEVF